MNPVIRLRGGCYLLLLVVVCAMSVALAQRSATSHGLPATIIVVTNTNDSGPGSLRDALAIANDGDTIDATGVSGTILLTSGELQINHNVTINGPGAGNLAVNGNAASRVFENFASNVAISGFTITNGAVRASEGGGIFLNGGTVTVNNSTISNNSADCLGGGIFSNNAQLTVINSTISGNVSQGNNRGCGFGEGGGIDFRGGTLTLMNSTITGNLTAGGPGGGIYTDGATLMVTNSTISSNSGGWGGGINFGGATLTVTNSTISGNNAGSDYGGGIDFRGLTLTVTNSTISGNNAGFNGGGIHNEGTATIGDTVLNAGEFGGTIFNNGTVTSLGYNIASDNGGGVLTGPGDQINTDPMLGPLQDNGGPTFTHALLPGSPAIDAGDPNFTPPPFYDQRRSGFPRVVNGRIDKGSFEVQTGATPTPTPTAIPRATPAPRSRPTPAPRP